MRVLTTLCLVLLGGACAAARPPNVVLVFTDDQGYGDLGCYGATGFKTPHLDRLATEGLKFRTFYVTQAVCSASRASLLTGCYAERVGIRGALGPQAAVGLHPDEETIAELLKARGYATGAVGKWHLGHHEKFLPLQQGFDEYLGLPYSNDMWPVGYDGKRGGRKSFYPELPLIEGNTTASLVRTLADQDVLTEKYTQRAVRFIDENHDRPFFLYLAHTMAHVPLGVSKPFRGSTATAYGDVMQEIDASVGRVLAALERHGLVDNTIVIFLSDNGPWLNFGDHAGSSGGLREGKGTSWEGGVRVPCLIRWPGRVEAGRTTDALAASIDILPTIAAATGAKLPTREIDGVDLTPLLEGGASPRASFLYYNGGALRAVRDERYKLVFPHRSRSYVGVEPGQGGLPGPYARLDVKEALYDLKADPAETTDVQDEHPDVVAKLKALAESARVERREPGRIGAEQKPRRVRTLAQSVELATKHAAKYAGSLTDGWLGTHDHADGRWQGYEATDLDATVDLGAVRDVKQIRCRFLEAQVSWIFLPTRVEIAVSTDGVEFETVHSKTTAAPERRPVSNVRTFRVKLPSRQVRYVRVRAQCLAQCPEWHPGAGGKPWIFADEIIVR